LSPGLMSGLVRASHALRGLAGGLSRAYPLIEALLGFGL